MPPRKKKGKSKASANDPNADPDTMMAKATPSAGSSKTKGKRGKLTPAEKLKAALDKQAESILVSGARFDDFLNRAEAWWMSKSEKCIALFEIFDASQEDIVSYDEFKAGCLDFEAPLNSAELHLLCIILDPDETGEIEFKETTESLHYYRMEKQSDRPEDVRRALILTDRNLPKCKRCKMSLWNGENYSEQYPGYLNIHFKLITFDNFKSHPGHFRKVVESHRSVFSLIGLIQRETRLNTSKCSQTLIIFRDKSYAVDSQLPETATLEECGFTGGSQAQPDSIDLFYDYKVEFRNCPLLLCDHFFGTGFQTKASKLASDSLEERGGLFKAGIVFNH